MSRPWVSDDEAALLRAALTAGDEAARHWKQFTSLFEFEDIWDGERFSLLPAVHLALDGIDGVPEAPRLAGIHRRTWVANQLALGLCAEVISVLAAVDIPACLHGDLAVAVTRCEDLGARVVGDGEILLPVDRIAVAVDTLAQAGWHRAFEGPVDAVPAHVDGLVLFQGSNARVRLVWETCRGVADSSADRSFVTDALARAVSSEGAEGEVPVSSPDVLAAHALCAGMGSLPDRRLRSLWDLARMLAPAAAGGLGPTERRGLVATVDRLRIGGAASHTLAALERVCGLGIEPTEGTGARVGPASLAAEVAALPVDAADRRRLGVLVGTTGSPRRLPQLRAARARRAVGLTTVEAVRTAPGFLRARWGLRSTRALPGAVARRAARAAVSSLPARPGRPR